MLVASRKGEMQITSKSRPQHLRKAKMTKIVVELTKSSKSVWEGGCKNLQRGGPNHLEKWADQVIAKMGRDSQNHLENGS